MNDGRTDLLKRKRRHILCYSDTENEPLAAKNNLKCERSSSHEELAGLVIESSSSDERIPLTVICDDLTSSDKLEDDGSGETESETAPQGLISNFDLPSTSNSSSAILKPTPATKISILRKHFSGRKHQLPTIIWADETLLWDYLNAKDLESKQLRNSSYFFNHSSVHHRMRSVLLEWILEVCAVYKLRRETYYLAVDYIDRYLTKTVDISKEQLQLIGVTCLFIASKFEEISPPRLNEFAYITDGACMEGDILIMELRIMKALDWRSIVVTSNTWLTILLQILHHKENKMDLNVESPLFPTHLFDNAARLLDLCSLDNGFLKYSHKTMAVSILYLSGCKNATLKVADMKYYEICSCVQWMLAFWRTLQAKYNIAEVESNSKERCCVNLDSTKESALSWDSCRHHVNLKLLESAQEMLVADDCLLTPPNS